MLDFDSVIEEAIEADIESDIIAEESTAEDDMIFAMLTDDSKNTKNIFESAIYEDEGGHNDVKFI